MLCFRKFPVAKKRMGKRGGGESIFPSKVFLSHSTENFRMGVWEPFSVSLISGIEKIYASEGYVTIFCRNCFVSQC